MRLEVFVKNSSQLKTLLEFYKEHNIEKINVPCKSSIRRHHLLDVIKTSKSLFPQIDVVPHFSICYEYEKNRERSIQKLKDFILKVHSYGVNEVLLVSGGQKKPKLDSIGALQEIRAWKNARKDIQINFGVAFNPYLPEDEMLEERNRLNEKLSTGLVSSVWLQFGTDISRMKREVEWLREQNNDIKVLGSFFIPTKKFLAAFKFRPWRGVYISEQYLNNVSDAAEMSKHILKCYSDYKIEVLVESAVSSSRDIQQAQEYFPLFGLRNAKA